MQTANKVARYILSYCSKRGSPITNLQLQKILYYVQGKYIFLTGRLLFKDSFFAWRYGPVVPSVYFEYNRYIADPIEIDEDVDLGLTEDVLIEVNKIINEKLGDPSSKLVSDSHSELPWKETTKEGKRIGLEISNRLLFQQFEK